MSGPEERTVAAAATRGESTVRGWVLPGLVLGLLALAYTETARSFFATWSGRDDYSHGFLVPIVSLYLAWARRERLRLLPVRPDVPTGALLLCLGCAMLAAGKVGGLVAAEQASVLLVAPGLVLLLRGRAWFRELLFPLAYLALMVPAAVDPLIAKLHWPLQLFGSTCASSLISLAGIPVIRDRQFIALPNVTLEVANVCSGVRYLISIIALSLPLAHLMLRHTRQRVLLVLAALLIGIAANPLRIALIAVWVYRHGADQIHGPGHLLHGFFVSLVGFGFLFVAATLISWWDRGGRRSPAPVPKAAPPEPPHARQPAVPWVLAAAVLGLAAGTVHLYRPRPVSLTTPLQALPSSIAGWDGETVASPASPLRLQAPDAELERIYRRPGGGEARLYIAYLSAQTQGRELVYYTFQRIYDRSTTEGLGGTEPLPVEVSTAIVRRGADRFVICYWYDVGGRSLARPLWAKLATAAQGLAARRTNGAVVAISRDVRDEHDSAGALEEVRAFARAAYPVIAGTLGGDPGMPADGGTH